jgi:hypothetical protein
VRAFDGVSKFKQMCKELDSPPPKPPEIVAVIVENGDLYDIYKRTTDLSINKCVGIGFTLAEAEEFIENRLKLKVDYTKSVITFYEKVRQGHTEAINPLWNPDKFVLGESDANNGPL